MTEPMKEPSQAGLRLVGTFPLGVDESDELPENPSHIRPAEFTLVLTGYDVLNLWERKLISKDVALLLILAGIRETYRQEGASQSDALGINFDCATFSRNWETPMDDRGNVKRFALADVVKIVEKLSQSGDGLIKTNQLSLEIRI